MERSSIFPILKKLNFEINILYNSNKYNKMTSVPTCERYDEDVYFMKFKSIHPYLQYSCNKYNLKKKEFQIKLLEKLQNNLITDNQFKEMCELIIVKENDKKKDLEELKAMQKHIINLRETELNTDIEDYMKFII
jgi:hypothetical protein